MVISAASAFFYDDEPACERGRPAMDACALCAKPLARENDIFMYRGDTPFCTDDCRHNRCCSTPSVKGTQPGSCGRTRP
jgi:hypothetical protein